MPSDEPERELSFRTIAASGKNGPILHYETNRDKMKRGDLVMFDLGARYCGYAADVSRTYPVSGTLSDAAAKAVRCGSRCPEGSDQRLSDGVSLVQLQETTARLNAACPLRALSCLKQGSAPGITA